MSFFGGTTSTPVLGGGTVPQFSFGTPAASTATTTAGFSGFGFGAANPAATSTASVPTFGFGGASTTPAPAFGFGQAPAAAPAPASTGFGFGIGSGTATGTATAVTSAAPFSFGLGGGTTTPAAGLGTTGGSLFGNTQPTTVNPQPAAAAPATGFGFGSTTTATPFSLPAAATTAAAGGFSFGQSTPATSLPAFGASTTTTQSQTQPTSTPAPISFGLGTPATTASSTAPLFGTTAPAFGLGSTTTTATPFGASTSTAPTTTTSGFSFGLGLGSTTATSTLPTFGSTTTATTQPVSGGLGGVFGSSMAGNAGMGSGVGLSGNSTSSRVDQESVNERPIPAELLALVEELKTFTKNDKVLMAEVSRATYRCVEQVSTNLEETRAMLMNTSNIIQRHIHSCEAFKQQMNQDQKDAEMAQITRDTPAVLQSENHLPMDFFYRLFDDYENRMEVFKREIRKAESAIAALDSNTTLSSRDLCMSLKCVKDSLLVIAAKVKTIHERVNAEVETHKNLLRFVQGDNTGRDIFGERVKDHQQRNRWGPKSEEATTSVFPSRIKDPAKLYMNYIASSNENPFSNLFNSGSPGFGRSCSVFTPSRFYQPSYPGYGSATLFQSPSSPILNSLTATSPPHPRNISLKRTKH